MYVQREKSGTYSTMRWMGVVGILVSEVIWPGSLDLGGVGLVWDGLGENTEKKLCICTKTPLSWGYMNMGLGTVAMVNIQEGKLKEKLADSAETNLICST